MTDGKKKIIVIGAGASGIAAAIESARKAEVTVLEHKEKALKKLLITGNGRCNFSNTEMDASHYHGDRALIESVLNSFSVDRCLDLMTECHVEPLEVHYRYNDSGYFYPSSNKAETVRDGMLRSLKELGGTVVYDVLVTGIVKDGERYLVQTDNGEFPADAVIFACGSNAAPETGSDSSIYPVLMDMGVSFKTFLPALTGIKTGDAAKELAGMRCTAEVSLSDLTAGTEYMTEDGEVQFGKGYLSGLPVMQLSRYVSTGKKAGHEMVLHVRPISWENVRSDAGSFPDRLDLPCTGTRGFSYAQCCTGGVEAKDLDPETLQYKKMKNIYFCGEMIDVDGDCGGYNLHFAFGSGTLAGKAATL